MFLTASTGDRSQGGTGKSGSETPTQALYAFYILKRQTVIFACEWHTRSRALELRVAQPKTLNQLSEQHKLLSGLLFSIKTFCQKLNPTASGSRLVYVNYVTVALKMLNVVYGYHQDGRHRTVSQFLYSVL